MDRRQFNKMLGIPVILPFIKGTKKEKELPNLSIPTEKKGSPNFIQLLNDCANDDWNIANQAQMKIANQLTIFTLNYIRAKTHVSYIDREQKGYIIGDYSIDSTFNIKAQYCLDGRIDIFWRGWHLLINNLIKKINDYRPKSLTFISLEPDWMCRMKSGRNDFIDVDYPNDYTEKRVGWYGLIGILLH